VLNLTFIGPCIVVYFYSKTNEMHQFLKFILFISSTLHVSDCLSVHHQESETVHTASGICQTDSADCLLAGTRWNFHLVHTASGICQTDSADCLLVGIRWNFHLVPASKQSAESVWHIPDALCTVLDSWWWMERLSETCRVLPQNKINLRNWCISLVLLLK